MNVGQRLIALGLGSGCIAVSLLWFYYASPWLIRLNAKKNAWQRSLLDRSVVWSAERSGRPTPPTGIYRTVRKLDKCEDAPNRFFLRWVVPLILFAFGLLGLVVSMRPS